MSYIILKESLISGHPIENRPAVPEGVSFTMGRIITAKLDNPLVFETKCPRDEHPGHFHGGRIPVVSGRFIDVLKLAGIDNYQIFPAILENPYEKAKWENFFAFNCIGILSAVNKSKSNGTVILPGNDTLPNLTDYRELVLDKSKVNNALMFREVEYPIDIIFTDKLEELLRRYKPPEAWCIKKTLVPVA